MNAAQAANSGAASSTPAPEDKGLESNVQCPMSNVQPLGVPDYFSEILPAPPRICGLPLKPLSIGRYRRMKRQNVAFVADGDAKASVGDLLKGVLICSMTCAEYDEFIADPSADRQVRHWGEQLGFLPPRYLRWGWFGRFINWIVGPEITQRRAERDAARLYEEMQRFNDYIQAGQHAPDWWDEGGEGRTSTVHWSHSTEATLREKLGWDKEEVEEEPLTKALWDYFKSMENLGLGYIMSAEEAAELKRELTPAELEESRVAMEKLWRFKFGDVPMPCAEESREPKVESREPDATALGHPSPVTRHPSPT